MYKLNKLSYEYDALEPYIDTHTFGLHHNKHQQNYINKLNELLVKNEFKKKALSIKGSGYTFLVINGNNLEIVNLLNQDNPYYHNYIPLIGLDM